MSPSIRTNPYPVGLLLKGKQCLVVGGGNVAARKVSTLLEHGARVTVVSPEMCPELKAILEAGKITWVPGYYSNRDMEGMKLVVAATNETTVNLEVSRDARNKGVWVNVVDDEKLSDFILPAFFCRGNLMVTVSTSGQSPALARKIKQQLEQQFGEEYSRLVDIVGSIRHDMKMEGKNPPYSVWHEALDTEALLDLIKQGEIQAAREFIKERLAHGRRLV